MNLEFHKHNLVSDGYTIIDDVLPLELAISINEIYKNNDQWEIMDQIRPDHYGHVFKSDNPNLPHEGEVYTAKFKRSDVLRNSEIVNNAFENACPKLIIKGAKVLS